MAASTKKTKDAHRVVCRCKTRECYRGQFLDAYGQAQSGVEVLPSTRDAHARADLRKQASESCSQPAHQTLDELVEPLQELHLPSKNPHPRSVLYELGVVARQQPLATGSTQPRTTFTRSSHGSLSFALGTVEEVAPTGGSTEGNPVKIPKLIRNYTNTDSSIPSYDCGT